MLLDLLVLYVLLYFSKNFNERLIFYELFCKGPSALRKYALMAVRESNFVLSDVCIFLFLISEVCMCKKLISSLFTPKVFNPLTAVSVYI